MTQVPHPDHPRPDFRREPWVSLNGAWSFDFDAKDAGEKERWFDAGRHAFSRRIAVPYPWESRLSGIHDTEYQGVAWYAREITVPTGPGWHGKDVWLVVGACDFEARVWINGERAQIRAGGKAADEHAGGYTPFAVNVSKHAKPGEKAFVVIRAKDLTAHDQPTGKQVNWYTRTSGIWQTVYLEPRAATHIEAMRFSCQPDASKPDAECPIAYAIDLAGADDGCTFELRVDGQVIAAGTRDLKAVVASPKLWHPDHPHLYDATIAVRRGETVVDEVHTYFGLRSVSVGRAPGRDYNYILLNGRPIYLRGALHQSFHPDGIYQYPDDATIRGDYEFCKKAGLNCLRIHIKTPIPRELYWADRLGVLVIQDIPNFWQWSDRATAWYEALLRAAIARDYNHPAIFAWCTFNETWGIGDGGFGPERQTWVESMWKLARRLDPTRLVEDNSPCNYDHVETDINSWHFYINDYAQARAHIQEVVDNTHPGSAFNYVKGRKQAEAPLINSEYGGIGAGSGDVDISWCLKYLTNELRRHDKICGYIYTELSDIEWEHNGLLNYDRTPKEYGYEQWQDGFTLADIFGADFVVIDAAPCITMKPGDTQAIPVAVSHWSERDGAAPKLRWRVRWMTRDGRMRDAAWQERDARWAPYAVTPQDAIEITAPANESGDDAGILGTVQVELVDGETVLARNYVHLHVDAPYPRRDVRDGRTHVLRFDPRDFAEGKWGTDILGALPSMPVDKVWGCGAGGFEYRLRWPEGADPAACESLEIVAELAAKARDEKLAWPARRNPADYPQTDAHKWPSVVRVSVNNVAVDAVELPDDPADARGVLSHVRGVHPGSYGWLHRFRWQGDALRKAVATVGADRRLTVRFEVPADAAHRGGLAIFGDAMGRYPIDPTCVLTFAKPLSVPAGEPSDAPVTIDRVIDRLQVLVPTAERAEPTWRYTTQAPPEQWAEPDFDASAWKTGRAGFGMKRTPGAIIRTRWDTADIWLRTEFEVKDRTAFVAALWRLHHDEDVEVFLNGRRVLRQEGYRGDYVDVPLDADALDLVREGRNVLAVHCHQTQGGQYVDVGLTVERRPDAEATRPADPR